MTVVVVESPTKAKSIGKYLGPKYTVLSSFGHVRALPSKVGSVLPEESFKTKYEIVEGAQFHIDKIVKALKQDKSVLLATDPDREGEAISWHLLEVLKERMATPFDHGRITFNEVTKKAILQAVKSPREINMDLVNAQRARQALDYLVGFVISPLLWRRIPGSKSAGRVQSAALKILYDRDLQIAKFKPVEFWTIEIQFKTPSNTYLNTVLIAFEDKKLDKLSIESKEEAEAISRKLKPDQFRVTEIEQKTISKSPYPPFTTSTVQQEASRKLGFSPKKTMMIAQKLYEGMDVGQDTLGLITYMRTDSTSISKDAVQDIRSFISKEFGVDYLPAQERTYKNQVKNAQEAHEAIRPTSFSMPPSSMAKYLDKDSLGLYSLIWNRTVASQMSNASYLSTSIFVEGKETKSRLKAQASILQFAGFRKLYIEGKDQQDSEEEDLDKKSKLPKIDKGVHLIYDKLDEIQHFTESPPKLTEASLIKEMERLGIGRPSTYTTIVSILKEREYANLNSKEFTTTLRGMGVTLFLTKSFCKYVDANFTAYMEKELDEISLGKLDWMFVMNEFWADFKPAADAASKDDILPVLQDMAKVLGGIDENLPSACPVCKGQLVAKFSKFGAFFGCSNYPDCSFTGPISQELKKPLTVSEETDKIIGNTSIGPLILKKGKFGNFLQAKNDSTRKLSLPPKVQLESLTDPVLEFLVSLPETLGKDKDDSPVILAVGPYGPYVKCNGQSAALRLSLNDLSKLTLDKALDALARKDSKEKTGTPLGRSPKHGDISLSQRVFGKRYVNYGDPVVRVLIPKDLDHEEFSLHEATNLIDSKSKRALGKKSEAPKIDSVKKKKVAASLGQKKADPGKILDKTSQNKTVSSIESQKTMSIRNKKKGTES